jgi:hypothetical protein
MNLKGIIYNKEIVESKKDINNRFELEQVKDIINNIWCISYVCIRRNSEKSFTHDKREKLKTASGRSVLSYLKRAVPRLDGRNFDEINFDISVKKKNGTYKILLNDKYLSIKINQ